MTRYRCSLCWFYCEGDDQIIPAMIMGLCSDCFGCLVMTGEDVQVLMDDADEEYALLLEGGGGDGGEEEQEDLDEALQESFDNRPPKRRRTLGACEVDDLKVGTTKGDNHCSICLDSMGAGEEGGATVVLPCSDKHEFHKHCVGRWLQDCEATCPLCKAEV